MRQRLHVKVEVELHSITCPGVWLCPVGYIEVTVKSLGYFFKAGPMEPKFPLLCHDLFVMEGYFKSVQTLRQLEKMLRGEDLEIAIWQNGRRLAYYRGSLGGALQSLSPLNACATHQAFVQLLMTPSRNFPGVLAPKIELSARALVPTPNQNRRCNFHCNSEVLMPCIPSLRVPHEDRHDIIHQFKRQRPVCHSTKCSRLEAPSYLDSCTQALANDGRTPVYVVPEKIRYANRNENKRTQAPSYLNSDTEILQNYDRTPVYAMSQKGQQIRCGNQNDSKSTSRNSSNSTLRTSDFLPAHHQHYSDNHGIGADSDEGEHSNSCHICQSYRDIFS